MIKHVLTAGIFVASLVIAPRIFAQTYDANAQYLANELGANETNSSFGQFSVGYGDNFGAFTAFNAGQHTNAFIGDGNTQGFFIANNASVPAVAVNVSNTNNAVFGLAPHEIFLHPGNPGGDAFAAPISNGVVRFTVPSAGLYTIQGNFRSLDGGYTLNSIFRNGTAVVSIGDQGAFRVTLSLASNETIDFAVGDGGNGIGSDSTALTASLIKGAPAPQIVNIDFNGHRDAEPAPVTYVGPGAVGSGTFFNPLSADSTIGGDNLSISGSNLLNDAGQVTGLGFSIAPVGGDNNAGVPTEPAALYDDYIFNHSAGNSAPGTGSPFVFSGFGVASTADLYFYLDSAPGTITLDNFAGSGVVGTYNGLAALAFIDVPVTAGSITGSFGPSNQTGVLSGVTVAFVPEPGTASLLGIAGLVTLLRRRRR